MGKGRRLQTRLREYNLSSTWLINELAKRGVKTEKTEVSCAFAGTRRGDKIDTIVDQTQLILDEYESSFLH